MTGGDRVERRFSAGVLAAQLSSMQTGMVTDSVSTGGWLRMQYPVTSIPDSVVEHMAIRLVSASSCGDRSCAMEILLVGGCCSPRYVFVAHWSVVSFASAADKTCSGEFPISAAGVSECKIIALNLDGEGIGVWRR